MFRVLAACECSGRVRDAFAARGWEAWSCDILPSETVGQHYQGNVLHLFDPENPVNENRFIDIQCERERYLWDLVIAFPPCTDLSLAGAVWWKQKQADGRQQAAARFFMQMINAPAKHIAVENPTGIMNSLYRPPDQIVEPWWFGDPYFKKTGLWLKNLPKLVADRPSVPTERVATGGGSWRYDKTAGRTRMSAYEDSEGRKNRAKVRSRTFPGFARAFADQYGAYIEQKEQR